ncbi:UEV domain-containing protein [Aspergillus karnatakaensis]|uniref:putative endosomal sorting complex protein TSG101 n=1 Tax=Aspergillus karnatakaensis TaxID=1810916 RepID=UPI003CCE5306
MASVPQRTLNWLYSVLIRDHYDPRQTYQDPNRTYYDVANVLAKFPALAPRTEVYTYENGFSALLLQLSGTLPVTYRGTVYKFPVALWIPNTYPREPPIAYVTPTQDMAVRAGQHVTLEGRIYHHYLAHWAGAWERSSLLDFLSILQDVFAKEPPVKYRQQQAMPQQQQQVQAPPPRPPLPPELASSAIHSPSPQLSATHTPQPLQAPPPPPPKPGQIAGPVGPQQQPQPQHHSSPPPLPPLPPKEQSHRQSIGSVSATIGGPEVRAPRYLPPQGIAHGGSYPPPQQAPPLQPMQQPHSSHPGPAAFQGPTYHQAPNGTHQSTPQQHQPPHAYHHYPPPQQAHPHPPGHWPSQPIPTNQHQHPRPKPASEDLLTSPFELDLPSFKPTGPAPPIPPNPEKDALIHAVSKAITETLHANIAHTESAAQALSSQSHSLYSAIATIQGEIASLNSLNAALESNTTILQQSLHRADAVIADAQSRSSATHPSNSDPAAAAASGLPPIDDILVAPTVVGKQLYDLVAEERGIQQAIYALQAALVKGVIGVETWSRHTRGLAREAFLKRALIRKIGKGMGLEEYP